MDSGTKDIIGYFLILTTLLFVTSTTQSSISGSRAACSNEGEEVLVNNITHSQCYRCICLNGFVDCDPESCPAVDDCYMLMLKPEGVCCNKCIGCMFKGKYYASGEEWSEPDDPCANYKCVGGVVTESNIQCYTPCSNPIPPRHGQCCPTCLGCYLNGQNVLDGREVTLSEDPCLKCHCSNKKLMCMKKACPVLLCPPSKQIRTPGECCPKCSERREVMQIPGKCINARSFYMDGKRYSPDLCSMCTCVNGTSICERKTCPVLECAPELQKMSPSDCCSHCPPVAEVRSTCTVDGKTYESNETWNLGPCRSCKCHAGEIRCAQTKCPKIKCKPNEIQVIPSDQCCAKCEESPAVCTVFGDPHYKTFDGKFYSFQGSCKYQLTADCTNHTFSIRVTNDGRKTKSSSWTKTVTLKLGGIKVNLGQKMRVKVNGTRIEPPYKLGTRLSIEKKDDEGVSVETDIGIKLLWDGNNFLQVQAPPTYKNKLCGLCGNYNNIFRDDLVPRRGNNVTDNEVWVFANSWRVGGTKACAKRNENFSRPRTCTHKKYWSECRPLRESDVFGECDSRLNPTNYHESCKKDMCECASGTCHCESFAAYAHECQRIGVKLPNWREKTNCILNNGNRPKMTHQLHQMQRDRKRTKRPMHLSHMPKTILIHKNHGQTPPPLH